MRTLGNTISATEAPSLFKEFLVEQMPLIIGVLGLGFAAAYLQHGFLPRADVAFPLAGVRVSIWHLIWMGFWAGYTMAIVGETGAGVGVISAALGVGGGFLLVPIFAAVYGLPMYVLVAATIPFVIVLSAVGLFTYGVILPAVVGTAIAPEWAWGLFAATGGILGSWCAAKTQRFVPEHSLKLMLGGITGIAGILSRMGLLYSSSIQNITDNSMRKIHAILPYLPFIVLVLAVVGAVYHIKVYW